LSKKHRRSKYQRLQKGDSNVSQEMMKEDKVGQSTGSALNIELEVRDDDKQGPVE